MTDISDVGASGTTSSFPTWTFQIPVDVANLGFQIAIYGQDPDTDNWMYWSQSTAQYVQFSSSDSGQDMAPVIDATTAGTTYTAPVSFVVNLPASQQLQSGVVALFIGGSSGIPVASGIPASPTTSTNPNDLYSLFEFTYSIPQGGTEPLLDIDISNVDQVGFTYAVQSSSAPFPLAEVGSTVPQQTVFNQFGTAFAGTAFQECVIDGMSANGAEQLRLLAPQDVLQEVVPPDAPSYLAPTGAPSTSEPFAENTYFYLVSETSATGETVPNAAGVFGGFLLNSSGQPQAAGIDIGWQSGGSPASYTPANPIATGINIYRASAPAVNSNQPPPATPSTGYGLLTGMSIADWNAQQPPVFFDNSTSIGTQTPKLSSYGFSALSTWFDAPLQDFFSQFASNSFALYQFNQNNGTNGTLWTGTVVDVTPNIGDSITDLTYIDENGNTQPIDTAWTWGDGTQTCKVLQLVGNAYNPNNYSDTSLSGSSGLAQGEYQGAVVNIYFPYFTGNTGLSSIQFAGGTYTLPNAPSWMNNAGNGPSHMVFGCAGVFATPNDPDAVAQDSSFPVLATNALTNIQNVIVSGLNRGVATGYNFALMPQQYTCLYGFSQAPAVGSGGTLAPGTYTYYLSGTLNDGSETALTWPQSATIAEPAPSDSPAPPQPVPTSGTASVTLVWLPQPPSLYKQVNVYRQSGTGPIELIGTVANTAASQATTFVDTNATLPTQPTNGAPFVFYPAWNDPTDSGFVNSNLFSAFLHQNLSADPLNGISINGLVYGYPFDDQGNFSTNINYGTAIPQSVTFAITTLT